MFLIKSIKNVLLSNTIIFCIRKGLKLVVNKYCYNYIICVFDASIIDMVKIKNILKVFFLDWIVTAVMYVTGYIFSGLDKEGVADITTYFSNLESSPLEPSSHTSVLVYLFASLSFVVLISYLINKGYVKVSLGEFLISQILYIASVVLAIFVAYLVMA
jgi:hypothetical protein